MFSSQQFLTDAAMARITEMRVTDPEFAWRAAQARTRRDRLVPTGKLNILAADHPARRVTKVGDNPIAMADRQDYLARILRVLSAEGIDGLMATMDILEDLFTLEALVREAGGASLLDGKVLIGSLNRGGLAGTAWELDDPITGPTPATCSAWRLDGAKILLRIADGEPGSLKTMLASAQAVTECNALKLPMFLEPLPVVKTATGWSVTKDREALARIAGVASALGDSSRYMWLKLPYCAGYETVARSTSLPILLLGGESAGNPAPFLNELACAMHAGPNVRGALVGRNVLYPGDEDPLAMACAVGGIIHQGWSVEQALESLAANRGAAGWMLYRGTSDQRSSGGISMATRRVTMAQALLGFLKNQYVERDGVENRFFEGAWGIFGHGIIAGFGQALQQNPDFPYYLCRNEQAAVHIATAFAKSRMRLSTFACLSSIGPGATNMITGAATATINRIPVLLLPGDIFARRNVAPVLQQLECEQSQDASVNDCFKPVSRYWDRINRPDQLPCSVVEAMRVLTSPAHAGAVVLALPQDVQSEAWDFPEEMFQKRVWHIARAVPEPVMLTRAVEAIRVAKRPFIVAGGGVLYSQASTALASFAARTGIPVGETQAGKGSLPFDHPCNLGAVGVTGTPGANIAAREADLVIAIGTRLSDFTTASKTAFQNPNVRFINMNVAEFDAFKHAGLPLIADARVALEQFEVALAGYTVDASYTAAVSEWKARWEEETDRLYNLRHGPPISQGEVIGAVSRVAQPQDVVINAAGSLPGDLHKLWRTQNPGGYHMEYGYSCMGYEIAGGLGVKMADPSREVYVMVGDGSFLMMSSEIATSVQEGYKLNIIVLDNHGYSSIGGLSRAIGSGGFGTDYRCRTASGHLDGEHVPVDFAALCTGLGARTVRARTREELEIALAEMRGHTQTTAVVVEVDKEQRVPGYESWWDVPISEVSELDTIRQARAEYEQAVRKERRHEIAATR